MSRNGNVFIPPAPPGSLAYSTYRHGREAITLGSYGRLPAIPQLKFLRLKIEPVTARRGEAVGYSVH